MNTAFALYLAFFVDNPNTRILIHKLKDDPDSTIKLLGLYPVLFTNIYTYIKDKLRTCIIQVG
jgi:hypothetical protein